MSKDPWDVYPLNYRIPPGTLKYHNKKTEVDGLIFDSRREANRYLE